MTMHPELVQAFDMGLPMTEVIRIFTKHHSGPVEEKIDVFRNYLDITHNNYDFWDFWSPLFHWTLPILILRSESKAICESFLHIHKALTREVVSWLCDSGRKSNIYLIAEPWIPGQHNREKSRAAVFAKICSNAQRFGPLFLHLHHNSIDNISLIIVKLAAFYPPYRRILTQTLIDNPGIHELPMRTYFKKLIHEPWKALRESHPQYITTPPVIILSWGSKRHDEELLHSICEFGSSLCPSSLLWIISINPEYKLPTQDILHSLAPFRYFRLPICYNDAQTDTALVLHHQFSALCHKHMEMFDADEMWPSEEQMSQLIRIVSGVFEFVDVLILFVDYMGEGGPRAHLETFLAYMIDSPSPSDEEPYRALDHFYIHALSNIPPDELSAMKKAFGIISYCNYPLYGSPTGLAELACLLSLGNDIYFPHLGRLGVMQGKFYNKGVCFSRFLEDPNRSSQFYTPYSESSLHVFQASLHILSHSSNFTTILKGYSKNAVPARGHQFVQGGRGMDAWSAYGKQVLTGTFLLHRCRMTTRFL